MAILMLMVMLMVRGRVGIRRGWLRRRLGRNLGRIEVWCLMVEDLFRFSFYVFFLNFAVVISVSLHIIPLILNIQKNTQAKNHEPHKNESIDIIPYVVIKKNNLT